MQARPMTSADEFELLCQVMAEDSRWLTSFHSVSNGNNASTQTRTSDTERESVIFRGSSPTRSNQLLDNGPRPNQRGSSEQFGIFKGHSSPIPKSSSIDVDASSSHRSSTYESANNDGQLNDEISVSCDAVLLKDNDELAPEFFSTRREESSSSQPNGLEIISTEPCEEVSVASGSGLPSYSSRSIQDRQDITFKKENRKRRRHNHTKTDAGVAPESGGAISIQMLLN